MNPPSVFAEISYTLTRHYRHQQRWGGILSLDSKRVHVTTHHHEILSMAHPARLSLVLNNVQPREKSKPTLPKATMPATGVVLTLVFSLAGLSHASIDRRSIISRYNPTRNASSPTTPLQIGNGNFAFGADVTGLQTFQPFAIMSSWGWKNDTLPTGTSQADIDGYHGTSWLNHGRLVEYDFGGGNPPVEQWLISNPNRVNLGRVGLVFWRENGERRNVTEGDLADVHQELDLWTGIITSRFALDGEAVTVTTSAAQKSDSSTIGVKVVSPLLLNGRLGVFLDFPWNDGKAKFSAPYVGRWGATANHTTNLLQTNKGNIRAQIVHTLDSATFVTSVGGNNVSITRDTPLAHRYSLRPPKRATSSLSLTVTFGTKAPAQDVVLQPKAVVQSSTTAWHDYWTKSGFVDLITGTTDLRAEELQRRIILSRYLMRVNEAGDTPPQEVFLEALFLI